MLQVCSRTESTESIASGVTPSGVQPLQQAANNNGVASLSSSHSKTPPSSISSHRQLKLGSTSSAAPPPLNQQHSRNSSMGSASDMAFTHTQQSSPPGSDNHSANTSVASVDVAPFGTQLSFLHSFGQIRFWVLNLKCLQRLLR